MDPIILILSSIGFIGVVIHMLSKHSKSSISIELWP